MPAGAADWDHVRKLYEQGLTAYAIEREVGAAVSRQAILKRARKEGWLHGLTTLVPQRGSAGVPNGPETEPADLAAQWAPIITGKLQELGKLAVAGPGIERALAAYGAGGNHKMAAAMAGVSEDSWSRWREACPELERAVTELHAHAATKSLGRIDAAGKRGDWKADEALLKANPLTRDDWRTQGQGGNGFVGIEIVFGPNMPAEAMKTIDGSTLQRPSGFPDNR